MWLSSRRIVTPSASYDDSGSDQRERYVATGASRSMRSSSTSFMTAHAATVLEIDPMLNAVSAVTGAPVVASAAP